MCVCARACVRACVRVCVCVCTCACMHVCVTETDRQADRDGATETDTQAERQRGQTKKTKHRSSAVYDLQGSRRATKKAARRQDGGDWISIEMGSLLCNADSRLAPRKRHILFEGKIRHISANEYAGLSAFFPSSINPPPPPPHHTHGRVRSAID